MKVLSFDGDPRVPRPVMIHSNVTIECHVSPPDKHFANVNVIGMDFLVQNGLTLKVNYRSKMVKLMVEEDDGSY